MKKDSLIQKMIRFYAIILIFAITTFALLISVFVHRESHHQALKKVDDAMDQVTTILNNYQSDTKRIVYNLFSDTAGTKDLTNYFNYPFADYYKHNLFAEKYVFFPKQVNNLYIQYEDLRSVLITLEGDEKVYFSHHDNTYGKLYKEFPKVRNALVFHEPIINQETFQIMGNFYLFVDFDVLNKKVSRPSDNFEPSILILNKNDTAVYKRHVTADDELNTFLNRKNDELDEKTFEEVQTSYYFNETETLGSFQVYTMLSKEKVAKQAFSRYFPILVTAFFLDALLMLILYKTFGQYSSQVDDILEGVYTVRDGNYDVRIDLEDKESELKDLSHAINEMLDSISNYIEQIYQLEIRQRDINMMALQSQINPHFLYNTLEYIRMYAVSEGVDELADVVYEFSELLRNNISLEKETTLEKEIAFSEKYIFLYQMRYPNRLAYKFSIEDDLKEILIPKFTLQPLIENYLIHGVDYNRIDNALNVSAFTAGDQVVIQVSDNGKGISEEEAKNLQKRLDESNFDPDRGSSIGLVNVHQRLKAYFEDAYRIHISTNYRRGFKVELLIDKKQIDVKRGLRKVKAKEHLDDLF